MKKCFKAFMMSMTMFCAIPCPYHGWDEDCRPMTTMFLPFVGAWIGALWALIAYLLNFLGVPLFLRAAVVCAFPYVVTGGIHMDGFLDVSDAIRSWRGIEERRKILKDPHVGSFAVVDCLILVLVQFAAFCSFDGNENLFTLIQIPTVSRCVASICVYTLRPMPTSQYSGDYQTGVRKSYTGVSVFLLILSTALGFVFLGKYGFVSVVVALAYLLYMYRAYRNLEGMSGDISGYALTIAEMCGIVAVALL
ncbi:MAG: adenosylcobinamide-GDP ribazoletransferase [Oscillospiraceae bacterium]|nr:adenosylcobinamide-GDP ribazoletransferase [Oscillospiraceae bacterium]